MAFKFLLFTCPYNVHDICGCLCDSCVFVICWLWILCLCLFVHAPRHSHVICLYSCLLTFCYYLVFCTGFATVPPPPRQLHWHLIFIIWTLKLIRELQLYRHVAMIWQSVIQYWFIHGWRMVLINLNNKQTHQTFLQFQSGTHAWCIQVLGKRVSG